MKTTLKPLFLPPELPQVTKTRFEEEPPSGVLTNEEIKEVADLTQMEISLERLIKIYNLEDRRPKINRRVWHKNS